MAPSGKHQRRRSSSYKRGGRRNLNLGDAIGVKRLETKAETSKRATTSLNMKEQIVLNLGSIDELPEAPTVSIQRPISSITLK